MEAQIKHCAGVSSLHQPTKALLRHGQGYLANEVIQGHGHGALGPWPTLQLSSPCFSDASAFALSRGSLLDSNMDTFVRRASGLRQSRLWLESVQHPWLFRGSEEGASAPKQQRDLAGIVWGLSRKQLPVSAWRLLVISSPGRDQLQIPEHP